MHEKEIEKLQVEKEKVERQLAQEQHKIQRLKNRAAYYEKGDRRKLTLDLFFFGLQLFDFFFVHDFNLLTDK